MPTKPDQYKRVVIRLGIVALIVAAGLSVTWVVLAANRTWDGGSAVDGNWLTPANWDGNVAAPVSGDSLIFPDSASRKSNTNNYTNGSNFNSFTFQGAGFTLNTVSSNGLTLTAGISDNGVIGTDNIVNIPLTLTAPQAFTSDASTRLLRLQGNINTNGQTLTLNGSGGGSFGLSITGTITGTGGITKSGTGTARIAGIVSNGYLGQTTVNQGLLTLQKPIVSQAVSGNVVVGDGTGTANTAILQLLQTQQIPDNGVMTTNADGLFDLNGFSETLNTLVIQGGNVTIGAGTLTLSALQITGGNLSSTGAGKLALNGNVATFAAPSTAGLSGNVDLGGASRTFTLARASHPGPDLNISSVISNGSLVKAGDGILRLGGNNTYTGTTTINAGHLIVVGSQPGSSIQLTGGILGGSGTVGAITATGGSIEPARHVIAPNFNYVPLNVVGNVAMTSPTSYVARVAFGANKVADQLNVTGTVSLGNSNLQITGANFNLAEGSIVVINNDGADAVVGTFSGLPEGGSFVVGGVTFFITYIGGDGNDVVLTVPGIRTWDGITNGGGLTANDKWTTKENWQNDVAPLPLDHLVFNSGTRPSSTNDFVAGTRFSSITVTVPHTFNGNGIGLINGLTYNESATVNFDITLNSSQTFAPSTVSNFIQLILNGAINTNGRTLTLGPSGIRPEVHSLISGGGAVNVMSGALFTANNSYTGLTRVFGGRLVVTGSQPGSSIRLEGGTLGGTGTVGAIIGNAGSLEPSTGNLVTGGLTVNGSVSLSQNVFFVATIVSTPGSFFHSTLDVNGIVNLGICRFSTAVVNAGASDQMPIGASFVAINNDGTDPIQGTFDGMLQGAIYVRNNLQLRVNYAGGDGNDLVFTRVNESLPSLSLNNITVAEGTGGTTNATFTVSLSPASSQIVSVPFDTIQDGATSGVDYQPVTGTVTFNPGETTKTISVPVEGDATEESIERFRLRLSEPINASTSTANGFATIIDDDGPPRFQTLSNLGFGETTQSVSIPVYRLGNSAGTVRVDYATSDVTASQLSDYTMAIGAFEFNPGENSKTVEVLITDDVHDENTESFRLTLSNPQGGTLVAPEFATLNISDNDTGISPTNPIDGSELFVLQHYHDFLNRQPDSSGLAFWRNEIDSCGADANCVELKRIFVSGAFFLSIEFQETGYLVYRIHKASFGNLPGAPVPIVLNDFLKDTQQIGKGVIVGKLGWEQALEANKVAFFADFVSRTRFANAFPVSLSPAQFVDALFANAGVLPADADRSNAIGEFGGAVNTANLAARARALRRVAENGLLAQQETNRAFVLMQYFGYLRRNPNDPPEIGLNFDGYNFWLNKLNEFNGNFVNAQMVQAFITSGEYRGRFGP